MPHFGFTCTLMVDNNQNEGHTHHLASISTLDFYRSIPESDKDLTCPNGKGGTCDKHKIGIL